MKFPSSDMIRRSSNRGQVMVLIAMLATFLIGLGGLAVDLVLVYSVKTYLSTATDSAAMGGIRALERGVSYADQEAEIQRITEMLFDANFPDGLLLTGNTGKLSQQVKIAGKNMDPTAPPMFESDPSLQDGLREVRVVAEAKAPTMFMRIFGVDSVTVKAGAYAARRDVNIMVVLDRSGSMSRVGAWDDAQAAAINFIEQFDNNRDRVGVVTYGSNANVDVPLATGFKTGDLAKNTILSQVSPDGSATNGALGMWLAYSELLKANDPNALNTIVFFTDGQPSAFAANFNTRMTPANGGDPKCAADNKDAVIATYQDDTIWNVPEFENILGFWKAEAGPAPVRGGTSTKDFELVSGCSDFNSVWADESELVFDPTKNWPARWTATATGAPTKVFCIQPGAVGCSGDDGTYPYSISDPRLFSTSSNTSDVAFRGTNVHNGAKNLMLNIAQTARQDANLGGVHIHAIGLGGFGYDADAGLMKTMANDPTDSYGVTISAVTTEPQGSYLYAPTIGEMQEAFQKVRSEVMRLTK